MKIVIDTKDLRALLKFRKEYDYCKVFDSGDNTDGEGIWHCDVVFDNDPDLCNDGDGKEVYSFDSVYNYHGRDRYENPHKTSL